AEVTDGDAPIARHLPLVREFLAGDHAEERRLARPVGTDEADLLAPEERRGGLDEENLVAVLLADAVETNHGLWMRGIGTRCGALMPQSPLRGRGCRAVRPPPRIGA